MALTAQLGQQIYAATAHMRTGVGQQLGRKPVGALGSCPRFVESRCSPDETLVLGRGSANERKLESPRCLGVACTVAPRR